MKKSIFFMTLVIFLATVGVNLSTPSLAQQQDLEKKFMQLHQKELEAFMTKCSGCHSLQRVFAQKRTGEEWNKIMKQMTGKPHALISEKEAQLIRKWIDLMEAAMPVGP
ncbi:MAG: hypothetical protein FJ134_08710 [Deltaproteobacteria bacterium]|nr:hypothetical protein [Deltaproteobacteria bacterium]